MLAVPLARLAARLTNPQLRHCHAQIAAEHAELLG